LFNTNKIKKENLLFLALAVIFISSFISADSGFTTGSTSVVQTQYFSPSVTNSFASSYGSYLSTSSRELTPSEGVMFDMQVFIPPLGCQPYVVRSDLLEEQNVPVFCRLVPFKINPGIDITRIDRINIQQKEANPYIAGIGFHPAQAAIRSTTSLVSTPKDDNLGYVVVVLKRQESERNMPESVNVTLSATLEYGGSSAFGIGQSEYYLPVLNDADFENNYQDYGFFNGIGYLRVESIDAESAVVSVYSGERGLGSGMNRVFSQKIDVGETSGDFYIPTMTGGQGIRISLKGINIPETKAKIRVNGQDFEVYRGGTFYNGKCTLRDLEARGGGTGYAKIYCGKTFELERQFTSIDLSVLGNSRSISMYQKIEDISVGLNNYYLVYAGEVPHSDPSEYYIFIANFSKAESSDSENFKRQLIDIGKKIGDNITAEKSLTVNAFNNKLLELAKRPINYGFTKNADIILITSKSGNKDLDISFQSIKTINRPISERALGFFNNALAAFDYVKSTFGNEASSVDSKHVYGEDALWREYQLAVDLSQLEKSNEILSRITNDYPDSKYGGRTARQYLSMNKMFSNENSYAYYDKEDLSIELISVQDAKASDSSVQLSAYVDGKLEEEKQSLRKGDIIYQSKSLNRTITLSSFTEDNVYINYSCILGTGSFKIDTVRGSVGKDIVIPECSTRIVINNINFNKVARIQLNSIVTGRSRETNFTFSIGIEKRAISPKLTPEEANKKIASLDKQIAQWKNITEKLGKFIEAEKAACLVTSAYVNLKNLYAGRSGEATARTEVMKRWNERCASIEFQKESNANSVEECIANNYKEKIEPEILATKNSMTGYNSFYNSKTKEFSGNETKIKQAISENLTASISVNVQVSCVTDPATKESKCQTLDKSYVSKVLAPANLDEVTSPELTEIYFYIMMAQNSELDQESQKQYQELAYSKLKQIEERVNSLANEQMIASEFNNVPLSYLPVEAKQVRTWENLYWNADFRNKFKYETAPGLTISDGSRIAFVKSDNLASRYIYLVVLEGQDKILRPRYDGIYKVIKEDSKNIVSRASDQELREVPRSLTFEIIDAASYKNLCKNCKEMKVFALEPYKGLPALLPFDEKDGWYVQIKQTVPGLGTGNVKSYQDSGRVNTFWLCNVGRNGLVEQVGYGDDICRRYDMYTGDTLDTFPGLTRDAAKVKVSQAIKAIEQAESQLASNPSATEITITQPRTLKLKVKTSEGDLGSKCSDFMSPEDCQLIFNVCDPVVCPNSRCDLGGRYKVDNVIQSGIVGSTVLCLPNFIGFHPNTGVIIPVCLTGINAGIEALTSIMQDYRDCLNESVTTGKMVGVCDMIYSVYVCDFFWRQVGPFVENLFKNLFITIFEGKGDKGGAEYAFAKDSLANAEKSAAFMQNTYGSSSKLSFGFKEITQTAVAEVCKSPFSLTYPKNFDMMLEPESPVQFAASFDERTYSDATVPPTSMYSVSYFIYAGNDQGHYYQIYLKSAPTALGYVGKDSVVVASGYIEKGQKASYKKDFLDVSGYKELCVKIDIQEKCGFKSVSTDFALDYAKNSAVSDQAKANDITTENECISGSRDAGALLNINIQQGVEEALNPELYNQGIIRVCSTENPGAGVDKNRWTAVGYCDDKSVKCWIDGNSVKKAITAKGIENDTLAALERIKLEQLNASGYFDSVIGGGHIKALKTVYDDLLKQVENNNPETYDAVKSASNVLDANKVSYNGRTFASFDEDVKSLSNRLIYNKDKADLAFYKGEVYAELARKLGKNVSLGYTEEVSKTVTETTKIQTSSVENETLTTVKNESTINASDLPPVTEAVLESTTENADVIAVVCGVLGFSGFTTSVLAKEALAAVDNAPTVTVASSSGIIRTVGSVSMKSSKLAVYPINGINYVMDSVSGQLIGQISSGGQIVKISSQAAKNLVAVSPQAIGTGVIKGLNLASDATYLDEAFNILEDGTLVATKTGSLKLVSNLGKIAPILSKISLILAPVTVASTLCDLGTLIAIIDSTNKDLEIMDASAKAADSALASLVQTTSNKMINVNAQIFLIEKELTQINEEDPELANLIQNDFDSMKNQFTDVKEIYSVYKSKYTEYLTNDEIQDRPTILWVIPVGSTSKFSEREYLELQKLERQIRQGLVDIQEKADDISKLLLDYTG
jgi:hypothetical protein